MKSVKIKILIYALVVLFGVGTVAGVAVGISLNKDKDTDKGNPVNHIYVVDYNISHDTTEESEFVVKTQERCTLCGDKKQEKVLDSSEYILIRDTDVSENAYTIAQNGVYILQGSFSGTKFTINAENVSLVGIDAETENVSVNYSDSNSNTTIYGLNFQLGLVAPKSFDVYGHIQFIKCSFASFWLTCKKQNIDIVVDSCNISGDYGMEIFYNKQTDDDVSTDKVAGYFTNNVFNAIVLYPIFFCGSTDEAEIRDLEIVNNKFINGWGDGNQKRAVLKLNIDKNFTPVGYDDITDTTLLTDSAKDLVRKVLNSNNTFDKAGKNCSYFNFRGIYFDTID